MTLRTEHIFWAISLFTASTVGALGADATPQVGMPNTDAAPAPQLGLPPVVIPDIAPPPAPTPTPAPVETPVATPTPAPAQPPADEVPTNSAGIKQGPYSNGVAAVVNDKIITMTQLIKQCRPLLDAIYKDLSTRYPPTQDGAEAALLEFTKRSNDLGAEMLHGMVDHILIVAEFRARGYTFPQSYLDWQFDDDMVTTFQGDHDKYLRYLQAHEMTDADYRRELEERDIEDAMIQQLRSSVTGISPDRIKAYYEQHKQDFYVKASTKVRRITLNLTPVADVTPDLYLQQAAKIVQEARQPGASFTDLAKLHSTDPSARNGDISTFTIYRNDNTLPPALQEAVFKLQPGEVSDPLVSDKLIFIFKCEDRTEEGYLPLEKVRTEIEKQLGAEDLRDAREKWLQKLRNKAFIQYNVYGPANGPAK